MKMRVILPLLFLTALLASCGAPTVGDVGVSQSFFAMDTVMGITLMDGTEDDLSAAILEINALDAMLSRTLPESSLSQVNAAAGTGTLVPVPEAVFDAVSAACALAQRTEGAYEPTIAPLMDLWGFTTEQPHVPPQDAITSVLTSQIGFQQVFCSQTEGEFGILLSQPGMALDLGGIGKGFAAGQVSELLSRRGVTSALLSLGGNITALGHKENGEPWKIAVADPQDSSAYLCLIPLVDQTASTSGGYERYFEADGQHYHHILDPETGLPADSGLLSVTVVSSDPVAADALSTALFVMGPERGLELWRASEDFECILVHETGLVQVTEGLADTLEFWGESHGYTCETVDR